MSRAISSQRKFRYYKGLTKPVLMTIAHLIISEPEEDERGKVKGERDPDAGWCVAGQDYIAAALGMSPDSVSSIVNVLKTDGWLEVVAYRTRRGYMKNRYRIPADKLEEMKARARKKDESGNFVREKQEKKVRNLPQGKDGAFLTAGSRKECLRQVDERPDVTEPQGLTASCGGPCGTEPSSVGFSGLSQQVNEAVKQADTDNTLRSDQGDLGPQKSKAFQFDEDDEPSTPVQPPAPQARVIPPPAKIVIFRRAAGHRFTQVPGFGLKCAACHTHYGSYDKNRRPCPNEEMDLDTVDDLKPEPKPVAPKPQVAKPDPADFDMDDLMERSNYKRALLEWKDSQRGKGAGA